MIYTQVINLSNKDQLDIYIGDTTVVKYNEHVLFQDILMEGVGVFKRVLERAVRGEEVAELNHKLSKNGIGFWWNNFINEGDYDTDDLSDNYWLWSHKGIETFLYTENKSIFLEIAPMYPWLFIDPGKNEKVISYEDFINSYDVISVIEIKGEYIKHVIEKCNQILFKYDLLDLWTSQTKFLEDKIKNKGI